MRVRLHQLARRILTGLRTISSSHRITSAQHPNLFAIIKFESIVHRFAERLISNSFFDDIFVLFVFA